MTVDELIVIIERVMERIASEQRSEVAGMGPSKERDYINAAYDGANVAMTLLLEELKKDG